MNHYYTQAVPPSRFLQEYGLFDLPTTAGDAARAVFEAPTMGGLLMRQQSIDAAEGARGAAGRNRGRRGERVQPDRVAPDVLNERYSELGLTFDRPMTEDAAQQIADGRRAQMIRDDIIRRAPSGVGTTAAMFGAGLVSMAVDPLEVASAFVPIVSQARMAGLVARYGQIGGRAVAGLAEGTVGAAITEPLVGLLSRQQQLDYTMSDALVNIGLGGLLGGGIGAAAGAARRLRGSTALTVDPTEPPFEIPQIKARPVQLPAAVTRQTPEQRMQAFRASVAQIVEGRSVDVAPMSRTQRPATLLEFLSAKGVRDQGGELSMLNVAEWTRARPGRRRLDRADGVPLDQAAEMAAEAGYISKRDVRELLDAIDAEARGRAVLSREDLNLKGMSKAEAERARLDAERFLEEFDAMADGLRGVGMRDVTPEEVQRGMEIARRDGRPDDFDHIAERLAIEHEAGEVAVREVMPERDRLADFESSERVRSEMEMDLDEELADLDAMVMDSPLTDAERAEVGALNEYVSRAAAYADTARVAAACLAR